MKANGAPARPDATVSRPGEPGGYFPRVSSPRLPGNPEARLRGVDEPWLWAASALVLLAATWLRDGAGWLAWAMALVFLALLVAMWRRPLHGGRWRRLLFAGTAALLLGVATSYHRAAATIAARGETVRSQLTETAGIALAREVEGELETLAEIAAAALDVPPVPDAAFARLATLVPAGGGRAVLVARGPRPYAWSGRLLVALDSLPATTGVVATNFYLVAYAVAKRGADVAVATSVVHAEPPADRLTPSIAARVAEDHEVQGFGYAEPGAAREVSGAVSIRVAGTPVLAARAMVPSLDALRARAWERALPRAAAALGVMVLLLLAVAWRRETGLRARFFALTVALLIPVILPFSRLSNVGTIFDPTFFVVPSGWRFTATAASLALTAALLLLALLSVRRAGLRPQSRPMAALSIALVAGLAPFLLRELASGIQVPAIGVPAGLWVSWQATIFLSAVTVLLLAVTMGQGAMAGDRGLPTWVAPGLAVAAAVMAPLLLEAPGVFPQAYTLLWAAAIVALAVTRRARTVVLPVAVVAACGATTLVWFSGVRERVDLAVHDVQSLSRADRDAAALLDRYANVLDPARAARTRVELLSQFARSDLADAEYPAEITTWGSDGAMIADLVVGRAPGATAGVNFFAYETQRTLQPSITEVRGDPGMHLVLAVPHADGTATTLVVAPRSRLVAADPFGAFLGLSPPPAPEPPYLLRQGEATAQAPSAPTSRGSWQRMGPELHGDWQLPGMGGMTRRVHAVVELRSLDALLIRGTLLVLFDLLVLGSVWLLMVMADGVLPRWWRARRREILTSYRTQLTATLFLCFLLPSLLFGVWSFRRLQADDRQARDLLVRETLRGVASGDTVNLAEASLRFETPLFLYANGLLINTSDPLLDALAPVGRLLPPGVVRTLADGDAVTTGLEEDVGPAAVRLGFRAATDSAGVQFVLAAPARLDERLLDRRRNDLAMFLLFALALGALAALWASGAASRQLSRPIRELRESALALARGRRAPPLREDPPLEFTPVFRAFRQMTGDLAESRDALEAAERRLAATLRNVASGVLAVDEHDRVTFANPRVESVLGEPVTVGTALPAAAQALLRDSLAALRSSTADDLATELEDEGRRLSVRLARLAPGSRRTVVTIDDVTEVTRAERVLAWGEMARQVAHEIKNPLTPMRLGLQHLRRARQDGRVDFDVVLEENTARMLSEIDRLDEIARAFSRYGTAPLPDAPPEPVDIGAVVRDVLQLERMGHSGLVWDTQLPDGPVLASARERELRDVLLNLLENARLAGAGRVLVTLAAMAEGGATITVADDGSGIPPALLDRIFEPHFSTRTSGSGLGLAISRRLIEAWGGTIVAAAHEPRGAVLTLRLAPASRG